MEKYKKSFDIFESKFVYIYLSLILFFSYLTVKNFSNYLKPFEDEITSMLSGISFIQTLDFDGSPLILGNYSPNLTSGPLASFGSSIGWLISKDFSVSRQFNFIYLVLLAFLLISLNKNLLNSGYMQNLFFVIFSIFLTPWWFGSLYSLGELFSIILFFYSALLIDKKPFLSIFLMSSSIVFGKLLQILVVVPFLLIFIFKRKNTDYLKYFISFISPFMLYSFLIIFKSDYENIYSYLTEYVDIVFSHQSSGLGNYNVFNLSNITKNINNSEFNQWSSITKLRLIFSPILILFISAFEFKNIDRLINHQLLGLLLSIFSAYFWFLFISDTKWIRYSQHFTYIIISITLIILFNKTNLSKLSYALIILNLALFLSSTLIFVIFIFTAYLFRSSKNLFFILTLTLFINLVNVYLESSTLEYYDLNFESCKNSIRSLECIKDYLPYELK